jgi:hypothetical protein
VAGPTRAGRNATEVTDGRSSLVAVGPRRSTALAGLPQHDGAAVRWYRQAAEQGLALAQFRLGLMHFSGRSIAPEDSEALHWCRRAAEPGLGAAQGWQGELYAADRGVSQDKGQAHAWFNLAAARLPQGVWSKNANACRSVYRTVSRVKSGGRVAYCLSPAGLIVCKDGSLCDAFPGSWTSLSTFYKLLEIERVWFRAVCHPTPLAVAWPTPLLSWSTSVTSYLPSLGHQGG